MNERILCLDIGDVRIGVAVSDATRTIATPVDVIHRVGFGPDTKKVLEFCRRYDTQLVLSGLPLNMDGSAGFQAEKVRRFCEQLEQAGLTVYYQDERLTTVTAEHALLEGNMHRQERKQNVDKVAAAVILQQWLDTIQNQNTDNTKEDTKMEEENSIIELINENGEPEKFEHLATLEYEGDYYIALMLADDEEEDEEADGTVVIMKIDEDENGEECYTVVEDEELEAAVFDKFLQLLEEDDGEA